MKYCEILLSEFKTRNRYIIIVGCIIDTLGDKGEMNMLVHTSNDGTAYGHGNPRPSPTGIGSRSNDNRPGNPVLRDSKGQTGRGVLLKQLGHGGLKKPIWANRNAAP